MRKYLIHMWKCDKVSWFHFELWRWPFKAEEDTEPQVASSHFHRAHMTLRWATSVLPGKSLKINEGVQLPEFILHAHSLAVYLCWHKVNGVKTVETVTWGMKVPDGAPVWLIHSRDVYDLHVMLWRETCLLSFSAASPPRFKGNNTSFRTIKDVLFSVFVLKIPGPTQHGICGLR